MWELLTHHFSRYPAQTRVAQMLLKCGLRVSPEGVHLEDIGIPDTSLARACGVDRRIITATVDTIRETPELYRVFSRLKPTLHLKDVAPALDWGVVEIVPDNARKPGILAHVATVLAKADISVRQAIVDDPELIEEPRLYVVTEGPIPMDVIADIKQGPGVRSVVIY